MPAVTVELFPVIVNVVLTPGNHGIDFRFSGFAGDKDVRTPAE
jgi:hypothetical protein